LIRLNPFARYQIYCDRCGTDCTGRRAECQIGMRLYLLCPECFSAWRHLLGDFFQHIDFSQREL
jgi:hypothetical protein